MLIYCLALTVLTGSGAGSETLSDEYILAEAKTFGSFIGKGEFEAAADRFSPALAKVMDASKLRIAWQTSTKTLGKFVGVSDASVRAGSRYQTAVVTCEFEKQLADLEVRFSSNGRVMTFYLINCRERPPGYEHNKTLLKVAPNGGVPQSSSTQGTHEKDRNVGPWVLCVAVVGLVSCLLTALLIVSRKKRRKA